MKSVHFGGKRKKHKFRALYDFYGKRVDYGDGEWPSVWPSEIEQDELIGWQRKAREVQVARGEEPTIGIPVHKSEPTPRDKQAPLEKGDNDWAKYAPSLPRTHAHTAALTR